MFGGIGWPEFMILLVAALVILGPERLPGAMQWTMNAVRQARDYVSGTADQLRSEIGPEVDQFREPLAQLRELRRMSPRDITTKYLLDGDDSILTGEFGPAPGGSANAVTDATAQPVTAAPVETVAFREPIPPENCAVVDLSAWDIAPAPESAASAVTDTTAQQVAAAQVETVAFREPIPPENCAVVDLASWSIEPAPELPRIDIEAT